MLYDILTNKVTDNEVLCVVKSLQKSLESVLTTTQYQVNNDDSLHYLMNNQIPAKALHIMINNNKDENVFIYWDNKKKRLIHEYNVLVEVNLDDTYCYECNDTGCLICQ